MPKATSTQTNTSAPVQESVATQNDATIAPKRRGRPTRGEAKVKRARQEQSDFLIGCSLDERAYAVRLVRLIRSNYWLSNFVQQILYLEADYPFQVSIEKVQLQLDRMSAFEEVIGKLQYIGTVDNSYFKTHPVVAAAMEEWGDELFQYKSNRSIEKLIESAKNAAVKK